MTATKVAAQQVYIVNVQLVSESRTVILPFTAMQIGNFHINLV